MNMINTQTTSPQQGLLATLFDRVKNDKSHSVDNKRMTLQTVRNVLTDDVFERSNARGVAAIVVNLAIFTGINYLLWNASTLLATVPLCIASGLCITSMFILGHDAAHGALFKSRKMNWWGGQLMMLPSLHAFGQWEFGHNRIHHGHTVKAEADFVWHPVSPEEYQNYSSFQKLVHKVSWCRYGAGIYYISEIWFKRMISFVAKQQKGARRDRNLVLAFGIAVSALSLYTGGISAFLKMVLVPFIIWNYVVGLIVYIHHINPMISWKVSKEWSPVFGQLFGTVNYHIPRLCNLMFHNIFIHMPHHVHMKIPYYRLPLALEQIKAEYGEYVIERKGVFKDYLYSTTHCKLYDAQNGQWVPYPERSEAAVAATA